MSSLNRFLDWLREDVPAPRFVYFTAAFTIFILLATIEAIR